MAQNLKDVHWTKDALCKFDKSFTSFHEADVKRSKEVCKKCQVQAECIQATAAIDGSFISAGTSKYDRLIMQWRRVENTDDSNFRGCEVYVSTVLRRVRKAVHS